ncbi:hypothetical protein RJZ56_000918 [Blastomyces dermatitidis]
MFQAWMLQKVLARPSSLTTSYKNVEEEAVEGAAVVEHAEAEGLAEEAEAAVVGEDPEVVQGPEAGEVQAHLVLELQGGSSRTGSGTPRTFGGGSYYAGGASVPYTAGKTSRRGLLPFAFLPLAALAFFPGLWLWGAHAYHIGHYNYRNTSDPNANATQIPIECLCQRYSVCGCEENDNTTYINELLKQKDEHGMPTNTTTVRVVPKDDGPTTIYVNGSLANGTTNPDPSIPENSGVPIVSPTLSKLGGYWLITSLVVAAVTLI